MVCFSCLSATTMPAKYNAIIGNDTNHIVTPLPSGVITAPNTIMAIIAYRKFLLQNLASTKPERLTAYIMSGNWNEIPNANKNCKTNVTKSIIFKKVTNPADSPYL